MEISKARWFVLGVVLGLAAALAVVGISKKARAQNVGALMCGEHDAIVAQLNRKYQEKRRALGLVNERATVELFQSKSGSWTILANSTNGRSCIIAAGSEWYDDGPSESDPL